jgi:hypothetical protein
MARGRCEVVHASQLLMGIGGGGCFPLVPGSVADAATKVATGGVGFDRAYSQRWQARGFSEVPRAGRIGRGSRWCLGSGRLGVQGRENLTKDGRNGRGGWGWGYSISWCAGVRNCPHRWRWWVRVASVSWCRCRPMPCYAMPCWCRAH